MPLSDDQKAMLRLLARGQSYEDIAALTGQSVDQVIARANAAVVELEAEGIPAPALPPTLRDGASQPEPPAKEAEPPVPIAAPPAESSKSPTQGPTPVASPRQRPKISLPEGNGARAAIAAGLAAVVAVVLVLVLSGGDSDDPAGGTAAETNATTAQEGEAVATGNRKPTTAQLRGVGGSEASGNAEFGRVEDSLALGINAEGLEPSGKGSIYMVWLADSPRRMLPLTAVEVDAAGTIEASYEVPTEAVVYLASGEFDEMVITRAANGRLRKSLERANRQKAFPTYSGERVLEGPIVGPIIGAQARLEAREKEEDDGE